MLDLESFEKLVIEEKKPSALCFVGDWCPPSKAQINDIEALREKYQDRFLIEVINVEQSPKLTKALRINNLPTTLFFSEGQLQEQNCLYGYQDQSMLTDSFECTLWELENKSPANKYVWWFIGALLVLSIILMAIH